MLPVNVAAKFKFPERVMPSLCQTSVIIATSDVILNVSCSLMTQLKSRVRFRTTRSHEQITAAAALTVSSAVMDYVEKLI